MIRFRHRGSFSKLDGFFARMLRRDYLNVLNKYGEMGVAALSSATPVDSGETASSWDFVIEGGDGKTGIYWTNSNENNGVNIALILQYGHGTGNGGYVQGIDYINPAVRPVFEKMADEVWKEVTK